jgi:pyruvate,orthophosphate dikinase
VTLICNHATGARELYFDFQLRAQAERIWRRDARSTRQRSPLLLLPAVWRRLNDIRHELGVLPATRGISSHGPIRRLVPTSEAARARARIGRRWRLQRIWPRGLLTPVGPLERFDGIGFNEVVRTSFTPPLLATPAEGGSLSASGAVALDLDSVRLLTASGTLAIPVSRETVTTNMDGVLSLQAFSTA